MAAKSRGKGDLGPLPQRDAKGRRLGRRGRGIRFSASLAEEICNRIAGDESLASICRDPHMPTNTTVYNWTRRYPEFRAAYVQARIDQADTIADQVSDIRRQVWEGDLSPARAHALGNLIKWETARRNPRGYGNRVTIDHEQGKEREHDLSRLSDADLATVEKILAKCDEADGIAE